MKILLEKINLYFATVPSRMVKRAKLYWFLFALVLGVLFLGTDRIVVDMSLESYFSREDNSIEVFNQFREQFGGDQGVYVVYEAKDGDVLSDASLLALQQLQEDLKDLSLHEKSTFSQITRITSLLNVNYLEMQGETLRGHDFIEETLPLSAMRREELRSLAMKHPDFPGYLISRDSKYGALMVESNLRPMAAEIALQEQQKEQQQADHPLTGPKAVAAEDASGFDESDEFGTDGFGSELDLNVEINQEKAIRFQKIGMDDYAVYWRPFEKLLQEPKYNALTFYPVGAPTMMTFFLDVLIGEVGVLFGGSLFLMVLTLFYIFRNVSALFWPLSVVLVTAVMTMGIVGWTGLVMSTMINVILLMILVVGVADGIHIMSGYLYYRRLGEEHEAALYHTYKKSGLACLLTSLTTSVGMLSLTLVPVMPIRIFGISAAIGVLIAYLLTIYFLPLGMALWPPFKKLEGARELNSIWLQRRLMALLGWVLRHPKKVIVVSLFFFGTMTFGFLQVRVESNMVEIIRDGYNIKEAYHIVDKNLGGTNNLEVFLDFKTAEALQDPEVLLAMERFQERLKAEFPKKIVKVQSLVDITKYSFQVLNEMKPEFYRLPTDRPTLAQTLILFDSTAPEDREQMVSDDFSKGRISVRVFNQTSSAYVGLSEWIDVNLSKQFDHLKASYPELSIKATGNLPLTMAMVNDMSWLQIRSFGAALVVVTLILLVVFGSVQAGLLAMIPNLFPVVAAFGMMGFLGVALDVDTLIIAPIIIGIAVDDTIHFLSHYKAEYMKTGDIQESLEKSMSECGQALVFTSMILMIGFSIMLYSGHLGIARFGILTAWAVFCALVADLVLLPALVQVTKLRIAKPAL